MRTRQDAPASFVRRTFHPQLHCRVRLGDFLSLHAPGLGLTPGHICAGIGLTPGHICAGTGLISATSAPGLEGAIDAIVDVHARRRRRPAAAAATSASEIAIRQLAAKHKEAHGSACAGHRGSQRALEPQAHRAHQRERQWRQRWASIRRGGAYWVRVQPGRRVAD